MPDQQCSGTNLAQISFPADVRVVLWKITKGAAGGRRHEVFLNSDALSVHDEEPRQKGFREPNYTQVPNDLMDHWLPDLTGAELKVLLYLVRRTFGFHRNSTEIGLRRICHGQPGKDRGTGLHLETASDAVKALESKGLLTATRDPGGRTIYTLLVSVGVYGKSEQSCSENPNGPVYGKSEHLERKSSSERKGLKESDDDRRSQLQQPPTGGGPLPKPSTKSIPSKADDEPPKTNPSTIYSGPEEELQDIYRKKALSEMPRDLLARIHEICELRGVTLGHYVEALRPHLPNFWKNPPGFLTDFARTIHSKTPGQPRNVIGSAEIETVIKDKGRCPRCKGIGTLNGEYCDCQLGRDLRRTERRMTRTGIGSNNGKDGGRSHLKASA